MNKRNTIQRSLVLETVQELRCHATADEIFNTIVKKYPNVGRGTVYRNLNLLIVSENVVSTLSRG